MLCTTLYLSGALVVTVGVNVVGQMGWAPLPWKKETGSMLAVPDCVLCLNIKLRISGKSLKTEYSCVTGKWMWCASLNFSWSCLLAETPCVWVYREQLQHCNRMKAWFSYSKQEICSDFWWPNSFFMLNKCKSSMERIVQIVIGGFLAYFMCNKSWELVCACVFCAIHSVMYCSCRFDINVIAGTASHSADQMEP